MAKKEESPSAQELVDENNEEIIELSELSTEERLERIEAVLAKFDRELSLLGNHSHDSLGRVVVPF